MPGFPGTANLHRPAMPDAQGFFGFPLPGSKKWTVSKKRVIKQVFLSVAIILPRSQRFRLFQKFGLPWFSGYARQISLSILVWWVLIKRIE